MHAGECRFPDQMDGGLLDFFAKRPNRLHGREQLVVDYTRDRTRGCQSVIFPCSEVRYSRRHRRLRAGRQRGGLPQELANSDSVPRPITRSVWAEEGARILEQGEIVPGHLASASLMVARATGADPKVLAAVIRGAVMRPRPVEALPTIDVPVLILNGTANIANKKIEGLLRAIPTARAACCEGDHHSTPYQPTFHQAVIRFFEEQWRLRR